MFDNGFSKYISSDDLEDIRKEIEKEEDRTYVGPLKTRSELSVKVPVLNFFFFEDWAPGSTLLMLEIKFFRPGKKKIKKTGRK